MKTKYAAVRIMIVMMVLLWAMAMKCPATLVTTNLYDDFTGSVLDGSKWTTSDSGAIWVHNSDLRSTAGWVGHPVTPTFCPAWMVRLTSSNNNLAPRRKASDLKLIISVVGCPIAKKKLSPIWKRDSSTRLLDAFVHFLDELMQVPTFDEGIARDNQGRVQTN